MRRGRGRVEEGKARHWHLGDELGTRHRGQAWTLASLTTTTTLPLLGASKAIIHLHLKRSSQQDPLGLGLRWVGSRSLAHPQTRLAHHAYAAGGDGKEIEQKQQGTDLQERTPGALHQAMFINASWGVGVGCQNPGSRSCTV